MSVLRSTIFSNIANGRLANNFRLLCLENGISSRTLYSAAALGLDSYTMIREKTEMHFGSSLDRFKSKMIEFSDENSQHMIFTEDLKSMVHMATSDDLDTVLLMMRKFNQQNKELRFGSFIFGPVVMRMYYYLNKPREALAAFKDEKMNLFFDQLITYQLLMDLLFNNQLYNEAIEVFNIIKERQVQTHRFPKNCVVLFFASCYKLNTPESFKLATDLWQELKSSGSNTMRRATTFIAMLAINQNAPHVALEIISTEPKQTYVTVRNIKAAALADLGRPEDVLPILRNILQADDPQFRKHTISSEVIDKIRKAVERTTDKEVVTEFQRLEKQLESHELVTDTGMDVSLCSEIAPQQRDSGQQRERMLSHSYNRRSGNAGLGGGSSFRQRPGLADMN